VRTALPTGTVLAVGLLMACAGGAPEPPDGPPPTNPATATPLARLAALDLDLADVAWDAACQVELTTPEGDLVARLDEQVRARFAGADAFDVEVTHRYDNRYQRGAVDAMRAVLADGTLAVRRQAEPFARVRNLHDEAARYRQAGLGLFPALAAAFAGEARREGARVVLVPVEAPATPPAEPPVRHDRAWLPAFRASLSRVAGSGELTWPEGAPHPTAGTLHVTAALGGHALRADCTLGVAPLPTAARPVLPTPLVDLDRPRVQRDLDDFLARLTPTGEAAAPRPEKETE